MKLLLRSESTKFSGQCAVFRTVSLIALLIFHQVQTLNFNRLFYSFHSLIFTISKFFDKKNLSLSISKYRK